MKKLLSILLAITLVISTTGIASAFTSDGSETFLAGASISGTAGVTVPFSVSLKNISEAPGVVSQLSWSTVTAGTTGWKASNQYIEAEGFATYSDWGIQIYTDNDNYTGTGDPAGLVRTDNAIFSLPMAWRVGTEKIPAGNAKLTINQETLLALQVLDDGITPDDDYFPWFFILDKNTTDVDVSTAGDQAFGTHQAEATFIGSAGYHHAPGDVNYATPLAPDTVYYLYFGANFTMAVPGKVYSTNTLTVEMYHL